MGRTVKHPAWDFGTVVIEWSRASEGSLKRSGRKCEGMFPSG